MNRDELNDCVTAWQEATAATEDDVARARRQLSAFENPAGYDPAELRRAPGPRRGAAARVQARLQDEAQPPPPTWGWSAVMATGMVTAALLALSLIGPRMAPEPWPDPAPVAQAPPFAKTLAADQGTFAPSEHVRFVVAGEGELRGEPLAPRVEWLRGSLEVDVASGQGVDLQVSTAEAHVAVIGTAFAVDRDARRGTRVVVRHGRVRVGCGGLPPVELGDGDDLLCPGRAALLGEARSLSRAGDYAGAVAASTRGLALGSDDAVGGELRFVRLESHAARGHADAARADAEAYLVAGGPRVTFVH